MPGLAINLSGMIGVVAASSAGGARHGRGKLKLELNNNASWELVAVGKN